MNMPVHERKFFINHLIEENDEIKKQEEKAMNRSKSSSSPNWRVPKVRKK